MAGYRPKDRDEIYRNMSAIRSTNNKTESALRKALHAMGLRYRKNVPGLPGRPDIVFSGARVAVFIDGDYWHGRMLRERGPDALQEHFRNNQNKDYWIRKMNRNLERDDQVTESLTADGWLVLRFWESDAKRNIQDLADHIATTVRRRKRTND